jgi:hypothetical protein
LPESSPTICAGWRARSVGASSGASLPHRPPRRAHSRYYRKNGFAVVQATPQSYPNHETNKEVERGNLESEKFCMSVYCYKTFWNFFLQRGD